jgi:hypothetical protein
VQGAIIYYTGAYTPSLVATQLASPFGVVVDGAGANVYWTDPGAHTVSTAPAVPLGDAGSPVTVLETGLGAPRRLVLLGASLYWADQSGSVITAAIDGGTPHSIASGSDPEELTTDGTSLYWIDEGSETVMKATADGTTPFALATGQTGASTLAVNDTNAYWTITDGDAGSIVRAPK